ncbi:hypothetical protein N657DRAFT_208412 [Parathielavia appendiculata]|uniref:Uncharacterized protein n=1 Tax=Parathielavia appendiculata TaxID=2587402 RepID=A0AAN6U6K8_9PEZI|nr:hypothetical protein N657DRAFT_208412 [Parathielavia appendiculata]
MTWLSGLAVQIHQSTLHSAKLPASFCLNRGELAILWDTRSADSSALLGRPTRKAELSEFLLVSAGLCPPVPSPAFHLHPLGSVVSAIPGAALQSRIRQMSRSRLIRRNLGGLHRSGGEIERSTANAKSPGREKSVNESCPHRHNISRRYAQSAPAAMKEGAAISACAS